MTRASLLFGLLMFLVALFSFQFLISGQELPGDRINESNVSGNQSTVESTGGDSWFDAVLDFFGLSGAASVVQTITDGLGTFVSTLTSFFSADVGGAPSWIRWGMGIMVTVPLTYIIIAVLRGGG